VRSLVQKFPPPPKTQYQRYLSSSCHHPPPGLTDIEPMEDAQPFLIHKYPSFLAEYLIQFTYLCNPEDLCMHPSHWTVSDIHFWRRNQLKGLVHHVIPHNLLQVPRIVRRPEGPKFRFGCRSSPIYSDDVSIRHLSVSNISGICVYAHTSIEERPIKVERLSCRISASGDSFAPIVGISIISKPFTHQNGHISLSYPTRSSSAQR